VTVAAEDWHGLVPVLERWAEVRVLGYGRLELRVGGERRELRLTPEQFDDIDSIMFGGSPESVGNLVAGAWDRAEPEHAFLNYDFEYGIEASSSPIRLPARRP
jgi:hypothetical protein